MGEEYQDVGQDVAQGEEAPGVQPVRRGGGCVVHGAGVEVALVHIPVYTEVLYTALYIVHSTQYTVHSTL